MYSVDASLPVKAASDEVQEWPAAAMPAQDERGEAAYSPLFTVEELIRCVLGTRRAELPDPAMLLQD